MKKQTQIIAVCIAAVALGATAWAQAQNYPAKPVRIICSFAPGGASETGLRILGQKLMENGWPQVIVDNRPGAGGSVAAIAAKTATPDGYTLWQGDITALAISPTLLPNIAYDPLKDFTPITNKFSFPSVLMVPANLPVNSADELIALLKQKQKSSTYASQGMGSGGHLLGTMFVNAIGFPVTHVPYKGGGQAVPEVVAGRVDMIFSSLATVKSFIASGQLRVLGVTSKNRLPELPAVPTMTELGYPSVFLDIWFGLVGPANLPAGIVRAVHEQVTRALNSPDVTQKMAGLGLYVGTSASPEDFRDLIRADIQRLAAVVKQAGAVAN